MRVADMAMKAGCATAIVLNKWDLTGGEGDPRGPGAGIGPAELDRERARVNQKLRLRPRVITASATTGRNVQRLLQEALSLADRATHRVPTPELNRFLTEVTAARQPRPSRATGSRCSTWPRSAPVRRASRSRSTAARV